MSGGVSLSPAIGEGNLFCLGFFKYHNGEFVHSGWNFLLFLSKPASHAKWYR